VNRNVTSKIVDFLATKYMAFDFPRFSRAQAVAFKKVRDGKAHFVLWLSVSCSGVPFSKREAPNMSPF
jgi:hypothetical protein